MRRALVLCICSSLLPLAARGELPAACQQAVTAIGWTEPERRAIDDPEAIRWPVDGTIRIAYSGPSCPVEEQFSLQDANGRPIPARVRVRAPDVLVVHTELPLTLVEIDPVSPLTKRTDYVLVWDAPQPGLDVYDHFTLELKTSALLMETVPEDDFGGILAVDQWTDVCVVRRGGGVFFRAGGGPPGCSVEARVLLGVRYEAIIRRDLAYVIERVSSTPLDGSGELIADQADDAVVPLAYERGGDDRYIAGARVRRSPVVVPAAPMPRRDCFRVRMLDDWGRPRGDPEAVACIDLPADTPCVHGAPPGEMGPAIPLRDCTSFGLNGADPYAEPRPDGGADGAVGAGEDGEGGGGGCACAGRPGAAGAGSAWWLLFLAPLCVWRRSRRKLAFNRSRR